MESSTAVDTMDENEQVLRPIENFDYKVNYPETDILYLPVT